MKPLRVVLTKIDPNILLDGQLKKDILLKEGVTQAQKLNKNVLVHKNTNEFASDLDLSIASVHKPFMGFDSPNLAKLQYFWKIISNLENNATSEFNEAHKLNKDVDASEFASELDLSIASIHNPFMGFDSPNLAKLQNFLKIISNLENNATLEFNEAQKLNENDDANALLLKSECLCQQLVPIIKHEVKYEEEYEHVPEQYENVLLEANNLKMKTLRVLVTKLDPNILLDGRLKKGILMKEEVTQVLDENISAQIKLESYCQPLVPKIKLEVKNKVESENVSNYFLQVSNMDQDILDRLAQLEEENQNLRLKIQDLDRHDEQEDQLYHHGAADQYALQQPAFPQQLLPPSPELRPGFQPPYADDPIPARQRGELAREKYEKFVLEENHLKMKPLRVLVAKIDPNIRLDGQLKEVTQDETSSRHSFISEDESLDGSERSEMDDEQQRDIRSRSAFYSCANKNQTSHTSQTDNNDRAYTCNSFSQYRLVKHTHKGSYSCSTGKKSFSRNSQLKTHATTNGGEKQYICHTCNKSFSNRSNIIKHVRTHSGKKPYTCQTCNKSFDYKGNLMRHMNIHSGEKHYPCQLCKISFSSRKYLIEHMRKHSGEKPSTFLTCKKPFSKKCYIMMYMRTHTGEKHYTCQTCNKSFAQKWHLLQHMRTHSGEKPFSCQTCNKSFTQKGHLIKHMRTHSNRKTYKCQTCNISFILKHDLIRHIRTHSCEKPFKCQTCIKSFTLKHDLIRHIRTHSGEKPFKCHTCNKSFTQKKDLISHTRIHTGEKPYTCQICYKSFTQKNILLQHMGTHGAEKPFTCQTCNKSFNRKIYLTVHLRTHYGEKPYTCQACNKSFTQKINLISHMRTHSDEKPFTCHTCKKSFTDKYCLIRHLITHSREKQFTCQTCNNSFKYKGDLLIHMRTHSGEKPYTCQTCTKSFSIRSNLLRHRTTHSGEKPYACHTCNKSFSRKSSLMIHMSRKRFKALHMSDMKETVQQ